MSGAGPNRRRLARTYPGNEIPTTSAPSSAPVSRLGRGPARACNGGTWRVASVPTPSSSTCSPGGPRPMPAMEGAEVAVSRLTALEPHRRRRASAYLPSAIGGCRDRARRAHARDDRLPDQRRHRTSTRRRRRLRLRCGRPERRRKDDRNQGRTTRGKGTCTSRTDRFGPTPRGSSGTCCCRRQGHRPCSAGGPRRPGPRYECLAVGRRPTWP